MKYSSYTEANNLTVIIPFLNEKEEVYNTVQNIRKTGGDKIFIMLINDASDDDYDYEQVAKTFNTTYIKHDERKGVATSRDEGIELCVTEFFLLMDAHMRFFRNDWVEIIISNLKNDYRALLCCQSAVLMKNEDGSVYIDKNRSKTYGAYIDFDSTDVCMQAKWNTFDPNPESDIVDIICVLGAGYACNKTYWKHLKGLEGLQSYGMDEQLISIKVHLEGGRCHLLKPIIAGHLYRQAFPYKNENIDLIYNKLYIAEMFLPNLEKYKIFKTLETQYKNDFKQAMKALIEKKDLFQSQKEYFKRIFTQPIELFLEQNRILQIKTTNKA